LNDRSGDERFLFEALRRELPNIAHIEKAKPSVTDLIEIWDRLFVGGT